MDQENTQVFDLHTRQSIGAFFAMFFKYLHGYSGQRPNVSVALGKPFAISRATLFLNPPQNKGNCVMAQKTNIVQCYKEEFPKKYKGFAKFLDDDPYGLATKALAFIKDEKNQYVLKFCNDYLEIPPVEVFCRFCRNDYR